MYPLLKYSYNLHFDERPDYQYIIYMLQKILLDRDYVPDSKFDWSLGPNESFKRVDPEDKHSSISSCGVNSADLVDVAP